MVSVSILNLVFFLLSLEGFFSEKPRPSESQEILVNAWIFINFTMYLLNSCVLAAAMCYLRPKVVQIALISSDIMRWIVCLHGIILASKVKKETDSV